MLLQKMTRARPPAPGRVRVLTDGICYLVKPESTPFKLLPCSRAEGGTDIRQTPPDRFPGKSGHGWAPGARPGLGRRRRSPEARGRWSAEGPGRRLLLAPQAGMHGGGHRVTPVRPAKQDGDVPSTQRSQQPHLRGQGGALPPPCSRSVVPTAPLSSPCARA